MCGILGYVSFSKSLCSTETFRLGLDQLAKRGPDAEGIYQDTQVLFGHRRLSIIDTSEGANQPFLDNEQNYVLIFNGEIFNYRELISNKLSTKNIRFRTHSDSEVLLHLLIHYGTSCLNWLSGFFAFAFYDIQANKVILGRDRFGKKPLVLFEDGENFLFASELKALLPLTSNRALNTQAVFQYFRFNYLPPQQSILKGFRKLPPGCFLELSPGQQNEHRYYTTVLETESYATLSYTEAQAHLMQLMEQSVRDRMISDVPVGAFLSGGIDSSVVVAIAAGLSNKLKTFSIGYKDNPLFDESKYAQLVADRYQTDHEVFYLSESDYKAELMDILEYLDEPFADSSCIPQYILCKKTKNKVTVALSGDGGDEVFAGYTKHQAEWMVRNKPLLAAVARYGKALWTQLPQNKNTRLGNITRKIAKLAEGAAMSPPDRYIRWCSILNLNQTTSLFTTDFLQGINRAELKAQTDALSRGIRSKDFNEVLLADLQFVLPGDMLHKVDMMSMANSLEVRSPFLDYRVVDFAFRLPASYKIDGRMKKKIVQDSFRPMLPEALYNRPKQGFEIPLLQWFRKDLNGFIFDELLNPEFLRQQGIFNPDRIAEMRRILDSSNPGNIQASIWALVVFQSWYKRSGLA